MPHRAKETSMRHFLPVWVGRLILATVLLRGTVALVPAASPLPRSSPPVSAFAQTEEDPAEVLFPEPFSVSRQLSLLCQQQHKQSCVSPPAFDSLRRADQGLARRSAAQSVTPPL